MHHIALCALLVAAPAVACTSPAPGAPPLSPNEVVHQQIIAYNAHDIDAFAACYSPDIRIYNSDQGEAPTTQGLAQLRARYSAMFKANPKRRAETVGRVRIGEFVSDAEYLPDVNVRAMATYEVKDGLITRVWLHRVLLP